MNSKSAWFSLKGDDLKLLEKIKKNMILTHGKISNVAAVRIALRRLEQDAK